MKATPRFSFSDAELHAIGIVGLEQVETTASFEYANCPMLWALVDLWGIVINEHGVPIDEPWGPLPPQPITERLYPLGITLRICRRSPSLETLHLGMTFSDETDTIGLACLDQGRSNQLFAYASSQRAIDCLLPLTVLAVR